MKILNLVIIILLNFMCYAKNYQNPNEQKINWIEKIEDYFNKELDSVKSDFIQIGSRGSISTGKIFLKRKKRLMKLYYNDPNPNVAIIKDYKLTHFERELKEKTIISVYSSPLSFFLEKKIDLQENVKIISQDESPNFIAITFKKKGDEDVGAITLVFSKKPFQLKGWTILENDNYGRQTRIILKNTQFNARFSDKEFDSFSSTINASEA